MKKILLTIFTIILILSVNILAVDIDIGNAAIDRDSSQGVITSIDLVNPADGTGKITSVEIWANTAMTNCEVATFYLVGGSNYSTRDYETIGSVAAGSKKTFTVDLDVVEGDYIGIYYTAGSIERASSGGNYTRKSGDNIPCTDATFTVFTGVISLHGIGTTVVGWAHKWNTQTISKWNTKEFTKWNGLE